jgi:hypothetical protein
VNSKTFVVGFFVAVAVVVGISVYLSATVNDVDKSILSVSSPDGRYKAVRVRLTRSGTPYCFDSVSVFLTVYPDSFAESERSYQVFALPCAVSSPAPQITWMGNDALRITYSPAPAGSETDKLRHRLVDASGSVRVSYLVRK